ncbi:hypothetical protein B0H14DRAFT_3745409 [Mycena olivaceomarginata]|nr:hypothetical protein B0H14DRAFT_3745409 [Mycena olivaceomarginata]
MMCIEHAVHIASKHFVEKVAPTPPKPLNKKIRQLLDQACESGEINKDEVNKVLSTLGEEEKDDSCAETDLEWTAGDAVGKSLALIKQIRMSPQARAFFRECCCMVSLKELELLLRVRTRWASLYKCLDRALEQRKAIDQFVNSADDSEKLPSLRKKAYREYKLSRAEWDKIKMIHEALREPANATQSFSFERTPTVFRIIPTFEFLIKRWETMALQPQYLEIRDALAEGVKSLQKWYHRADTTSSAYFICMNTLWQLFHKCVANLHTVLDPSIKDQYFRAKWDADRFGKAKEQLENVFDKYYAEMPGDSQALSPTSIALDRPG